MFPYATNSLLRRTKPACRLLLLASRSSAGYIKQRVGKWPEPLSQQTLKEFLHDINYFQEPRKFVNIGIHQEASSAQQPTSREMITSNKADQHSTKSDKIIDNVDGKHVDDVLKMLSIDAEIPPLNYDDVAISKEQLINMAINSGIYRDLFTQYQPNRDFINFTQQQAENMDKLVPYFWITDQPFARVNRSYQEPPPMPYFEPLVKLSARFVNTASDDELSAHTVYHGNFIPAAESLVRPSITLDGRLLSPKSNVKLVGESNYNNWSSNSLEMINFDTNEKKFYTITLVNLDYIHENASNLHWMVADIKSEKDGKIESSELCDYLPVHGIQGFGYSRYAFLIFQHDSPLANRESKIDDFSLDKRKFDANQFMSRHKDINLKPVGLSWFQTCWDNSSNGVFHNLIKQKAPVFEHAQTQLVNRKPRAYPGRSVFNLYLDHFRDKKAINEQVLLERLKNVDPSNYKDQYVPPKVPPTVFVEKDIPSWMHQVMFKKKNKLGYWRGLRPASKLLPLDNNVDLDYPIRPIENPDRVPPEVHNAYPTPLKRAIRGHIIMNYKKPAAEQDSIQIQDHSYLDLDKLKSVAEKSEKGE